MSVRTCVGCGMVHKENTKFQWWRLSDYGDDAAKFSGSFCNECYDVVALDAYGVPKHPKPRLELLRKMSKLLNSNATSKGFIQVDKSNHFQQRRLNEDSTMTTITITQEVSS